LSRRATRQDGQDNDNEAPWRLSARLPAGGLSEVLRIITHWRKIRNVRPSVACLDPIRTLIVETPGCLIEQTNALHTLDVLAAHNRRH
jgi:hypothetical protein